MFQYAKIMLLTVLISGAVSGCCKQTADQDIVKEKEGYSMKPGTIDPSGSRTW